MEPDVSREELPTVLAVEVCLLGEGVGHSVVSLGRTDAMLENEKPKKWKPELIEF